MEPIGGMTDPEKLKAMTSVSEKVKSAAIGISDQLTTGNIDMKAYIGNQLQAVYNEILQQPVPDRFRDLLRKLDGPGNTGDT
jgi:hypothetical protein